MNCPKCGNTLSRIVDTIRVPQGLRRHRICSDRKCRSKFRTLERIEEWDHTIRDYIQPGDIRPVPVLAAVPDPPEDRIAAKRREPYVAHINDAGIATLALEAQPLVVEWWNVSRRSKHGAKAAWTYPAFHASVCRVALLPAHQQVLLAQAGVEHGWQALKPAYLQDELAKPTSSGRPMPKDPAMLAALEQWPEQTA